jgi:hypothetical protein
MNLERIERALRDGPPDEPLYVPGTHRARRDVRLLLAAASAVLAFALVVGIGIGFGVSVLRGPGDVGSGVDLDALAANLEGQWISTEISSDEWVDGLIALGHDRDDVQVALDNFPPYEAVQWRLDFADDHLQIFGSFDGGPFISMSGGPYELVPDGSIAYDDIGCFMTIPVEVQGSRLLLEPMRTESCNADERLNNDGYFQLVEYERLTSPDG